LPADDAAEKTGLVVADPSENRRSLRKAGWAGRLRRQRPQLRPRGHDLREESWRQLQHSQELTVPIVVPDVKYAAAGRTGGIRQRAPSPSSASRNSPSRSRPCRRRAADYGSSATLG